MGYFITLLTVLQSWETKLTLGSGRITRILGAGLLLVTGFWLPESDVVLYSHRVKSPAP